MEMDIPTLHNILLHTFSNDANARNAAEDALGKLHTARGSIVLLVQLVSNAEVQREIRQAGAVALKNMVQKHWEDVEPPLVSAFSSSDKEEYRKYILEGLLMMADRSLRSLLAEAVNQIARVDFPKQWPGLVAEITKNVQSGDVTRICNALLVLRKLVKNYEFRRDEVIEFLPQGCMYMHAYLI
jgi:hypothetical protein